MEDAVVQLPGLLPPRRSNSTAWARRRDVTAWVLSLWFGCGLVPLAPGTAGTIGAVPLYLALAPLGRWWIGVAALAITVVAIGVSSRVAVLHGTKDPQFVCVDEVAGVFVTWLGAPFGWKATIAGVLLFRLFDTWKPFPARRAEKLPLGYGIVLDDVVAGVWGAAALFVLDHLAWL